MYQVHAAQAVKLCTVLAMLCGALETEDSSNVRSLSTQTDSCSLVIVSTLDGKLTALDAKNGGIERWCVPAFSGPLLSSSLSSFQKAKQVRLIPSLDGGLYQVTGEKLEAIPYTADNLLGSFHKLPDGSMLVGGKEAISCGIDLHTGKVRYICSADGCNLTESEGGIQDDDIFVLKRTQQTIRAVDQRTGSERWNFSVGQQDISFVEGIVEQFNNNRKCPSTDDAVYPEWKLKVSIPDGAIAAVQSHGSVSGDVVLWSHKFDSSIAAVWTFNGDHIQSVNLFSEDVMPLLNGDSAEHKEFQRKAFMYLGNHNGQLYVQSSQPTNPSVDSSAVMSMSDSKDVLRKTRQTTWRPYLTSSPSRTPTVISKELAVWNNPLEYPYDNGYYLCGDVVPIIPSHGTLDNPEEENVTRKPQTVLQTPVDSRNPMWDWWWGTILVPVLFITAIVQAVLQYWKPSKRKLASVTKAIDYQRIPSNTVTSCTSTASTETLKSSSLPSTPVTLTPSDSFISRYLSDFEHEQCLGKGGFGLVFQAKNKVDDCQYAIKRVRLPNCDEAREKVMREVKALAKLEHPGIVRYFNAWFEAPPCGWQEQLDEWMHENGVYCGDTSELASVESDQVMEASSDNNFYRQNKFFDDSKANGNVIRRRKKTSSSTKSRHSSQTSSVVDDPLGRKSTLVDDDFEILPLDILQLENDAFESEHDDSESFGIESASSSRSVDSVLKDGSVISDFDESKSHSIIFADSGVSGVTGASHISSEQKADITTLSSSSSSHSASGHSFIQEVSFSSANRSLLQGKQHKCQSKKCTADILEAPLYLYIQMQLCQRKSLKDWLRDNKDRDHVYCLKIFEQIVSAVEYFHGSGMMHRDLKPSNIFFSLDGSVKVGDFGLVTATVHDSTTAESQYKGKNGYTDVNHTGQVGTHLYMSPEQMEGRSYSHKVDVYSLGIIFFELFYSFGTQMERIKVMSDVKAKKFPDSFKASMPLQAEFVSWLLSDTPKERPNATEIKRSEIICKITQQAGL